MASLLKFEHSVRNAFEKASFVLGYGSGLFKQTGQAPGIPDFLVFTRSLEAFHEVNMKVNPSHYSACARILGSTTMTSLSRIPPHVHYSINSPLTSGLVCKYGVVDVERTTHLLTSWDSLYIPGRMQKPLAVLECRDSTALSKIEEANLINRKSALVVSALLSGSHFTLDTLWATLVSLSYEGDMRMNVAEAPTKITDIVSGQRQLLEGIYFPLFEEVGIVCSNDGTCTFKENSSCSLPPVISSLHGNPTEIRNLLSSSNRRDSFNQACKGLLTNPISNSVSYTLRKLNKRFNLKP